MNTQSQHNQSQVAYLGRDHAPPGLQQIASGKVRDIYALDDDHLLFVTTDRVSAFDVVMNEGIPDKGRVLTTITEYWFENTKDIIPNHLVSTDIDRVPGLDAEWKERLRGRILIVKKCKPDIIEWVVRGYIAGSGWKEYGATQSVCGIPLPAGLQQAQVLPEPILTPTTKEEDHDRPLTPDQARELIGDERFEHGKKVCLALFERGTEVLDKLGILLADTKFELGMCNGEVILIDEALTPDSSRFWPKADYAIGTSPKSYDKQILRDYLETLDWNKEYPAPELDPAVLQRVSRGYFEICELITGRLPEGIQS
ncbi:MAG: phosphoribosylaminoimidazolesuccinocarboxamide synthase [Planctomycetes bacterium]|nr:phosphoribosylaminoimidazolesuccinocarboxamide synthase [Planctomycetota bacterium]